MGWVGGGGAAEDKEGDGIVAGKEATDGVGNKEEEEVVSWEGGGEDEMGELWERDVVDWKSEGVVLVEKGCVAAVDESERKGGIRLEEGGDWLWVGELEDKGAG